MKKEGVPQKPMDQKKYDALVMEGNKYSQQKAEIDRLFSVPGLKPCYGYRHGRDITQADTYVVVVKKRDRLLECSRCELGESCAWDSLIRSIKTLFNK